MLFKLLGGKYHCRETGVTHAAKDPATEVVESDQDLSQIWGANKFQRIDYSRPRPSRPAPAKAAATLTDEQRNCGHRFGMRGICEICGADKIAFKASLQPAKPQAQAKPQPAAKAQAVKEKLADGLGDEVTDQFPQAVEMGMMVFANGDDYRVVESDDPNRPLNTTPLERDAVDAFIEECA